MGRTRSQISSPAGPPPPDDGFQQDAQRVVTEIRDLFATVIETAIGRVETAQEVADGFGVHRKLGWQLSKVAYGDEPFLAARFIPSPRGMRTWLKAARKLDVPPDLLTRVEAATEGFEQLIEIHCGDRETLELMLESCGPRPDGAADARWRREAFLGNSYIFGVRVKTHLSMTVLAPSAEKPSHLDVARLHGMLGFLRSRPNVRWVIAQTVAFSGEGYQTVDPRREPLDPDVAAANDGVPLIARFCTQPLPAVQRCVGPQGLLDDELLPGPVGQTGELDLVSGEVLRAVAPIHATHEGEKLDIGPAVRTPAEWLVADLFVHRDLYPSVERELRVYSRLFSAVSREERDLLVVSEGVQALGRGVGRIHTPEVPHYGAMAGFLFEQVGWEATDFDLFRVRMRYPPLPASVMFHHALPGP
jgi:hypothetical protein